VADKKPRNTYQKQKIKSQVKLNRNQLKKVMRNQGALVCFALKCQKRNTYAMF